MATSCAWDQGPRSYRRVYLGALEIVRTLLAFVPDGQLDASSLRSLDLLHDLRDFVTPDALPVYGHKHIVGTDTGLLGRRTVYRGGDHDLTVLLFELDPNPHVRSGEALVVLLALRRGQEARVPLVSKRLEHPFYGPVRLLLGVDVFLVHIVFSDGVERLGVQRQALPVLFVECSGALRASDHVSPETRSRAAPRPGKAPAPPRSAGHVWFFHTRQLYPHARRHHS